MTFLQKCIKPLLCSVFALTAVSCTNELTIESQRPNDSIVSPVKSPEFFAWSGDNMFSNPNIATRSADAYAVIAPSEINVNGNFFKICDYENADRNWLASRYPELALYIDNAPEKTDRGEYVSSDEYDFVMDYLAKHPDEGYTECDLSTYFIQNVGSSEQTYQMDYISDDGSVHHSQDVKACEKMNYLTINGGHVPDYNATDGKRALVIDVPVNNPTYNDSYGDQEQTKTDAYRYYYIEYNGKLNVYLCFDYQTKKYDNGMLDYQGDKVFNDWVFKLVPADGSEITLPDDGDVVLPPVVPEIPANVPDHVEINLSLNDSHESYEFEDLIAKLSIHVRAATDVEVFIPVPAAYYCEQDDLDIVLSHDKLDEIYGAESRAEYEIVPGHTVSITVIFEENGIRVVTDGIDQDVLDYCNEHYKDGVNFETWLYFNNLFDVEGIWTNSISREELMAYLNMSTVKFLDKVPDMYVNAFNDIDETGEVFPGDCTVTVDESQSSYFDEPFQGNHFNGSNFNEIYLNKENTHETE